MFRFLGFLGIALTVGGFLSLIIEIIGALTVERMPAWYLPLWLLITVAGVIILSTAVRHATRERTKQYPELSAPATVAALTYARPGSEDEDYYNIDLVVHPEGKPSYAYRHHRSLSPGEQRLWQPGHVVAVRRIFGSRDAMMIDNRPSARTLERIRSEDTLKDSRSAELTFAETTTPGPTPAKRRAANFTLLCAVLVGAIIPQLSFPKFLPMLTDSTIGRLVAAENHRGLFVEGALAEAVDQISPYLDEGLYRVEIDGNYTLTVWEVADRGTAKLDSVTIRADRIYGPAPLAYRPTSIDPGQLFQLEDIHWEVLPEALDICERHYEDPTASRTSLAAHASAGEVRWNVSYSGDYGSFHCTILANGEVIT